MSNSTPKDAVTTSPIAVLVGYRAPALDAAEGAGVRPYVVDERDARPSAKDRVAGWITVDFDDEGFADTVKTALDDAGVSASSVEVGVVACTERAVVPAASIREALNIDGLRTAAAKRCHDKIAMKEHARRSRIQTAKWKKVTAESDRDIVARELDLPYVLKPRDSSGSRGTTIIHLPEQDWPEIEGEWLAERLVEGEEMSIELFVVDGTIRFFNPTWYLRPSWANIVPADVFGDRAQALSEFVTRAVEVFAVRKGIVRLEVFETVRGWLLGEIAVRPPGGYIMPLLAKAYDFDPWRTLIEIELGRDPELPRAANRYAGVWILHPGPGTLESVEGLDDARALEHVDEVVWSPKPGDSIAAREGTGQSAGRILASGPDANSVRDALDAARDAITVTLESEDD